VEENVTGLLAPPGDAEGLAQAIQSLCQDARRRREMGQAAQIRARRYFSAEVIVPMYESLYRRVCG
jgi:glycosyltransferase involved in cell wall biosynthesis